MAKLDPTRAAELEFAFLLAIVAAAAGLYWFS